MAEFSYEKLVKLLKGDPDLGQSEAARQMDITIGQLSMMKFCLAQVEAGVYSKAPGTATSVRKLRASEGNRWELIAARTGKTVKEVKELVPDLDGGKVAGNGNGESKTAKKSASKTKTTTTGRKQSGRKTAAAGKRGIVRRTTRRSTASNPS